MAPRTFFEMHPRAEKALGLLAAAVLCMGLAIVVGGLVLPGYSMWVICLVAVVATVFIFIVAGVTYVGVRLYEKWEVRRIHYYLDEMKKSAKQTEESVARFKASLNE
jgi:amino acid transporter